MLQWICYTENLEVKIFARKLNVTHFWPIQLCFISLLKQIGTFYVAGNTSFSSALRDNLTQEIAKDRQEDQTLLVNKYLTRKKKAYYADFFLAWCMEIL